jgi:hypothetical protein
MDTHSTLNKRSSARAANTIGTLLQDIDFVDIILNLVLSSRVPGRSL